MGHDFFPFKFSFVFCCYYGVIRVERVWKGSQNGIREAKSQTLKERKERKKESQCVVLICCRFSNFFFFSCTALQGDGFGMGTFAFFTAISWFVV